MTDRDVTTMRRRQLAALHTQEMQDALFPHVGRPDDEISDEEKAATQANVTALAAAHRAEIKAWQAAN